MGFGRIPENPNDLALWQDIVIIQGKKERLANGKGGGSGSFGGHGHMTSTFHKNCDILPASAP
ncbi:hypothetical protein [Pseudogemmobacter blasticus]|uniref:hypothetical protein n=1 Tax=Fuscovulum blasticum TaxID=1075 RepID=UPI0015E79BFB|nr:hypothetical protein [Fuscovulum blasticum]